MVDVLNHTFAPRQVLALQHYTVIEVRSLSSAVSLVTPVLSFKALEQLSVLTSRLLLVA